MLVTIAGGAADGLPMTMLLPNVEVYPWLPYCNDEVDVTYWPGVPIFTITQEDPAWGLAFGTPLASRHTALKSSNLALMIANRQVDGLFDVRSPRGEDD